VSRPRNILMAMNAFKGTLTSREAGEAVARGAARAGAGTTVLPVADGGDGTLEACLAARPGQRIAESVADPLGRTVTAEWALFDSVAVVEMSRASGLALLAPEERNPLVATSLGTGQLMDRALRRGVEHVVVAVGGSATVDGGMGALCALGFSFRDEQDRPLGPGGGALVDLRSIHFPEDEGRLGLPVWTVLCDVANPLIGPEGAARVYGPQKGAGPEDVDTLEVGLGVLTMILESDEEPYIGQLRGGGAAGGLALGLHALLAAELIDGADYILDWVGFERALAVAMEKFLTRLVWPPV